MNNKIKTIVETTDVVIIESFSMIDPYATRGILYYEEGDYLVDIDVDGLTIDCNIWIGEIEYTPTDEEVDFFYNTISNEIISYNNELKNTTFCDYYPID